MKKIITMLTIGALSIFNPTNADNQIPKNETYEGDNHNLPNKGFTNGEVRKLLCINDFDENYNTSDFFQHSGNSLKPEQEIAETLATDPILKLCNALSRKFDHLSVTDQSRLDEAKNLLMYIQQNVNTSLWTKKTKYIVIAHLKAWIATNAPDNTDGMDYVIHQGIQSGNRRTKSLIRELIFELEQTTGGNVSGDEFSSNEVQGEIDRSLNTNANTLEQIAFFTTEVCLDNADRGKALQKLWLEYGKPTIHIMKSHVHGQRSNYRSNTNTIYLYPATYTGWEADHLVAEMAHAAQHHGGDKAYNEHFKLDEQALHAIESKKYSTDYISVLCDNDGKPLTMSDLTDEDKKLLLEQEFVQFLSDEEKSSLVPPEYRSSAVVVRPSYGSLQKQWNEKIGKQYNAAFATSSFKDRQAYQSDIVIGRASGDSTTTLRILPFPKPIHHAEYWTHAKTERSLLKKANSLLEDLNNKFVIDPYSSPTGPYDGGQQGKGGGESKRRAWTPRDMFSYEQKEEKDSDEDIINNFLQSIDETIVSDKVKKEYKQFLLESLFHPMGRERFSSQAQFIHYSINNMSNNKDDTMKIWQDLAMSINNAQRDLPLRASLDMTYAGVSIDTDDLDDLFSTDMGSAIAQRLYSYNFRHENSSFSPQDIMRKSLDEVLLNDSSEWFPMFNIPIHTRMQDTRQKHREEQVIPPENIMKDHTGKKNTNGWAMINYLAELADGGATNASVSQEKAIALYESYEKSIRNTGSYVPTAEWKTFMSLQLPATKADVDDFETKEEKEIVDALREHMTKKMVERYNSKELRMNVGFDNIYSLIQDFGDINKLTHIQYTDMFFDILANNQSFSGIRMLDCSGNNLSSISILPQTLTYLNCSNNVLTTSALLDLPKGLKNFNCGSNSLEVLPPLGKDLENLRCGDNKLKTLPALPATLLSLECSENLLKKLPDLPVGLSILSCSENPGLTLPQSLPSSLIELACQNNGLALLPPLPSSLIALLCKGNLLESLPDIPKSLDTLSATNNKFNNETKDKLKILEQSRTRFLFKY